MRDTIIEQILLDVCLDPRISDGIVDFKIQEHVDVLIEVLKSKNIEQSKIRDIARSLNEGKYPDRQAYNKEGFLVTFPNPDYKKRAIASGEYTNQDPTNGKGGMHLIKKVDVPDDKAQPQQVAPEQPKSEPVKPTAPSPSPSPTVTPTAAPKTPTTVPVAPTIKTAAPSPVITPTKKPKADVTQFTTGVPVDPSTDLKLDKLSNYKDPSLEWVHNRKWIKRENNNYYDNEGKLKAITGLDGSVVPVAEEERVGLKKFIDDKKKEKLGIETPPEAPDDTEKDS